MCLADILAKSVFRFTLCAHLSIVYVTYTIDECAHMRETECILSSFECARCPI